MPQASPHPAFRWPALTTYFLFLASLVLILFFWFNHQLSPLNSAAGTQVFVVKKGATIDQIGQALFQAKLIRNPAAFKFYVAQHQMARQIQAGTFKVSAQMSTPEIAQNLTHGTLDLWVTVLEGWRREETAAAIAKAYQALNYPFEVEAFLEATKDQEGYLYPDTYLLPVSANESAVAAILTRTFDQKVTQTLQTEIDQSGKSLEQIVTLASLIEREARSETARKMVSGILWNRLNADWPLQIDATLQYAQGYNPQTQSWWDSPLANDKDIDSPYNTYQNIGLPPGPICSPSLSSIQAALKPTPSDYWFYLTGNDNQMHYAQTLADHNANINQFLR